MIKNEILTYSEAGRILGLTYSQISNHVKKGNLSFVADSHNKKAVTRQSVDELKLTLSASAEAASKVIYPFINGIFAEPVMLIDFRGGYYRYSKPSKLLSNTLYGVTSTGIVINLNTRQVRKQFSVDHGYLQIKLYGTIYMMVHRLVAYAWCPNGRFVGEVHHIDGERTNNNADNLIWLTREEHIRADKLRKEALRSNDFTQYNNYIDQKKAENEWNPRQLSQGIRWIFAEDNTPNYLHIYYITEAEANRLECTNGSAEDLRGNAILAELIDCCPNSKSETE